MPKMAKHQGALDEKTVRVSYNSMKDRWYTTTSNDGHNITSVSVFDSPHQDECEEIAKTFVEAGFNLIGEVQIPRAHHLNCLRDTR